MSPELALEGRNIWFSYPSGPPVIRDISIQIETGSFTAIIGQNGSGKTTLMKLFNGLLRPDSGEIRVFGQEIKEKSIADLSKMIGFCFQNPDHQIFNSTILAEVEYGPNNLGLSKGLVDDRVQTTLQLFHLDVYANRQPANFGFGIRKKISLASVYAMHPPVLILDEPTTGLDGRTSREIMDLFNELNKQGKTILLITHDMEIVAEYAKECVVFKDGEVLVQGKIRQIFNQTELLHDTKIKSPQIHRLCVELSDLGVSKEILTVAEFCAEYEEERNR